MNKIIGNGDIAGVLHKVEPKGLTFFASGVSDSKETREREFLREKELLWNQEVPSHLVYFSSLRAINPTTPYLQHKRDMELQVMNGFQYYTIVRLGNITWGNNPNTIINFLKNRINSAESLVIKDEYKHLVGEEEFVYWMNQIPINSKFELNITGRFIKVSKIVEEIIAGKL